MTNFDDIMRAAKQQRQAQESRAEQFRMARRQHLKQQAKEADEEMFGGVSVARRKSKPDTIKTGYVSRHMAARMLWTCARGVMTLIERGQLDAVKAGGEWAVSFASIEKLRKG